MYCYVDESGNTGSNLFDEAQPALFYGVLTSKLDLDGAALTMWPQPRSQRSMTKHGRPSPAAVYWSREIFMRWAKMQSQP